MGTIRLSMLVRKFGKWLSFLKRCDYSKHV